jgi:hypothetical protein
MQYMLLIYDDQEAWQSFTDEERAAGMEAYNAFTQEVRDAGAFVAADALQPTETATTVRVRDGERLLTDGPFAETKEQLGGYYIVDVDSIEDAIKWAAKIPSAQSGSIEVRPVMVFDREEAEVSS